MIDKQNEQSVVISAIQEKLLGKHLTYQEIFAIMDEISQKRLGPVLTTYFAASGYAKGFSDQELYYLTRAMVDTGEKLHFPGIVADKHSVGGVPGTRTTLIVVPIVASAGFTIPKSSSRAITTPDGTADDMEVLSPVAFSKEELYEIVKKTHGCIVWGGSINIAPADDLLIQVEKPLLFESYDKIVVSIMAKKLAFGSNHVVIDLPYGLSVKLHHRNDALLIKQKFEYIARKFHIKLVCNVTQTHEPAGRGIGPVLETRDALYVLEQSPIRPVDLEERALNLAGSLLDLCLADSEKSLQEKVAKEFGSGRNWAKHILVSGQAFEKMKEIVTAQGGSSYLSSKKLTRHLAKHAVAFQSQRSGHVTQVSSKNLTVIAKILGAPGQKGSGVFLDKKLGEKVQKGDTLFTLYTDSMYNLGEAKDTLKHFPILTY